MNRREALKRTTYIMGASLSATAIAGLMSGCKGEPGLDWTPEILTPDLAETVHAMAEAIFPKTDTPGASEAGVASWIDQTVSNHTKPKAQAEFMSGLEAFGKKALEEFGKPFHQASPRQQLTYLQDLEKSSHAFMEGNNDLPEIERDGDAPTGKPFFRIFKELACAGYFSSEAVAKNYFKYDAIPGDYVGCVDYSEVGGQWAL